MNTARMTISSIEYRPVPTPPKIVSLAVRSANGTARRSRSATRTRVDRAARRDGRDRGEQTRVGDPEALLLALEVAAGRAGDLVRVDAGPVLGDGPVLLGDVDDGAAPTNRTAIAAKIAQPCRRLPTMRPYV